MIDARKMALQGSFLITRRTLFSDEFFECLVMMSRHRALTTSYRANRGEMKFSFLLEMRNGSKKYHNLRCICMWKMRGDGLLCNDTSGQSDAQGMLATSSRCEDCGGF